MVSSSWLEVGDGVGGTGAGVRGRVFSMEDCAPRVVEGARVFSRVARGEGVCCFWLILAPLRLLVRSEKVEAFRARRLLSCVTVEGGCGNGAE